MEISFVNSELSSNIDEIIAFAKKNDIKYVELKQIDNKDIYELTPDEAFTFSNKLSSNGILVSCLATQFLKWPTNKSDFTFAGQQLSSETEYFTKLMDLADIFGAPNIRIYSYINDENISIEDLGSKLDKYSQLALERGIALLLENDGVCNINNINKMHQLFELYNFSNIFPLLNLGTTIACEDDFNPSELQDIINTCQYFHITDYDAELKKFVVIGEGNVEYDNIIENKTDDRNCFLSLEPHTGYPEDLQTSLNVLISLED